MGNLESTVRTKPAVRACSSTAKSCKGSKGNVDLPQAVMSNNEVMMEIMSKLGCSELLKCRRVNQRFCSSSTAVLRREQVLNISEDSPADHYITWEDVKRLQDDRKIQALCRGKTDWIRGFPYRNVSLGVFVPYDESYFRRTEGLRIVELTVLGTNDTLSPAELHRELRKFPCVRKLAVTGGKFTPDVSSEELIPLENIIEFSVEVIFMLEEHLLGVRTFASCLTNVTVFNLDNRTGVPNAGIFIINSLQTEKLNRLSFSKNVKWTDQMSIIFAGFKFSKLTTFTWKPWIFNNTLGEVQGFQSFMLRIAPNLRVVKIGDGQETNVPLVIPICSYDSLREIVVPVFELPSQGALSAVSSLRSIRCGKLLVSQNNTVIFQHVQRLGFELIHKYEASALTEQQCWSKARLIKEAFPSASHTVCTSRNTEELQLFIAGFSESKAMVYDPSSSTNAQSMIMGDTQNYFCRKNLQTKVSLAWMTDLEELSVGRRVEWSNTSFKMLPWLNHLKLLKLFWPYGECSVKCFARNVGHITQILICNCHEPRVNREIEDFKQLRALLPQMQCACYLDFVKAV